MATIRRAAQLVNKPESTLYRWRKTNPVLYRAVMEFALREESGARMKTR